jgi:hypothetical protein
MKTTLNLIKEKDPCPDGWTKLLKGLGKTQADDEPLTITKIIETNGIEDAIWALRAVDGYDREKRLFACWCCDQIAHLITDERSKNAVTVARKFANGEASREELAAAWDAASAAASAAMRSLQKTELLRVCVCVDRGEDPYPKMNVIGIYYCQCGYEITRTTDLPMETPNQVRRLRKACSRHLCPVCERKGIAQELRRKK